ncbi:MAG TPA: SUMF1/EgtB/PvdO family nonheme iron enzyme [Armatimonadota bacterium]|nr:SUMF1/EgtB/PvdO family nonheme iron enzyme [Armatimonadota bacterium]HOS42204.1 SUMF1/EgtB/PvdO family nonheme iron enzyme [Armatimonadota bacterium]
MLFSCDRTGFPLVQIPGTALRLHLLPVSKVQFERYLAEPGAVGDDWYSAVLAVNPRASYRAAGDADRERLLLTGILPDEAVHFARWLGPGFDLPTADEWRRGYCALSSCYTWQAELDRALAQAAPAARELVGTLRRLLNPAPLHQLALMEGGVLEWVRDGARWAGYGKPRPACYEVICEPLSCPPVTPMRAAERLPFFGFRAVKRG